MNEPTVLNDLYVDVLANRLGLTARVVSADGLLSYSLERYTCLLEHGGIADPSYIALRLSFEARAFGVGGVVPDRSSLDAAAARVTDRIKVAKASVRDDHVVFSCELLVSARGILPTQASVVDVLPRGHELLIAATDQFAETVALLGIEAASA